MQELFKKYLDNQCSPEEVKRLLAYFNDPENEVLLRELIAGSLGNSVEADDERQWQSGTDRVLARIKDQIKGKNGGVTFFLRKNLIRLAAAAILILGCFWVYHSSKRTGGHKQEMTKTDSAGYEIRPGGNKAILTLADGSTIDLQTAANDTLARQGSITLLKSADGQLNYTSINDTPAQTFLNTLTTPRGGQYHLTLSDGSEVWLNAASSIHFPAAFTGTERVVEVTGEAYFEVAKNASMPFKVKVGGKAEVEVLGTHFNVSAYSEEPTINTTLLEGRVKVTSLVQYVSNTITPGEQAQLDANNRMRVIRPEDAEQAIAWKNGIFSFHNANPQIALQRIARWYDVDLVFEGPAPQKLFSGEMQRTLSISQIIKLLETNGVHCRIEGRKLIVMK